MTSLRRALLAGLAALTLGGCYTQLHPPGNNEAAYRSPPASRDLRAERERYVYHYHFDAHRAYDPFGPYWLRHRDPWRFHSSYYPSYRYYNDPYYSPYLDAVRSSWRWFGGAAIWTPVGVIVDSRWLPDRDPLPSASPRPRIRRSGFEGLPVPASDVRQSAPTTTYTPSSSTPAPRPSPPQEAPKQTQQSQQKKKDEEQSKQEKREEKREEQRRREGMR
jgi:hypothetical protein